MKISTQPYKGARDFYPEDKAFQKWMFDKWRTVVEKYGFLEMDAPILEPTDLYLIKGNQEIIDEQTYTFKDRGERSVTIRAEMTPSVSRMVAGRRQELAYPLRWYSIPNLWRYERMQRGRLREFWQLNIEMFGVANENAEIEMIMIVDDLFQVFKAKRSSYTIKINSRLLVNEMLAGLELSSESTTNVIRLIDRKNKMTLEEFDKSLNDITKNSDKNAQITKLLVTKELVDLPEELQNLESIKTINKILNTMKSKGVQNVVFDITLMRGFDYYTDIVFEAFDNDPANNRAVLGGGRYDGLVGQMGVDPVPTIGFAVGDVVFKDYLETHGLVPKINLSCELTVLIRDEVSVDDAQKVAEELREAGIKTSIDFSGRKLDKQIKSAEKAGVRFILFVGAEESKNEVYTLKDLKNGVEEKHSLKRIVSILSDSRR